MKRIIAILLLTSLSGCVYTKLTAPGGVELTRIAIGTGTNIGTVQIPTTAGPAKMTGYHSDQADVAAAVVTAAVGAAMQQKQPEAAQEPVR